MPNVRRDQQSSYKLPTETKEPGRNSDPLLIAEIDRMAREGQTNAAGMRRVLEADERFTGRVVPSERTILDRIAYVRATDSEKPWTLSGDSSPNASAVLELVSELARRSKGRRISITRREADLFRRVRAAAPDLPVWSVFRIVSLYRAYEIEDSIALDLFLSMAPWRNEGAFSDYLEVIRERGVSVMGPGPGHGLWLARSTYADGPDSQSLMIEGAILADRALGSDSFGMERIELAHHEVRPLDDPLLSG